MTMYITYGKMKGAQWHFEFGVISENQTISEQTIYRAFIIQTALSKNTLGENLTTLIFTISQNFTLALNACCNVKIMISSKEWIRRDDKDISRNGQKAEKVPLFSVGNLNIFTRPKSSPVTITSPSKLASTALTSFVSEYLGQMPLASGPRTLVHEDQCICLISSRFVKCFPAFGGGGNYKERVLKINCFLFHVQYRILQKAKDSFTISCSYTLSLTFPIIG